MNCQKCGNPVVFPEGLMGEIVCSRCGLVINRAQIARGFTQWTPKWFSNWSEGDSETLREWLTTLRTVSCQLNVPNFPYREEVARTIRQKRDVFFRSQKFGKNKRAAIAALIHLVLKEYDTIRPLKEICQKLALDTSLVMKYAWTMKKAVNNHGTSSDIRRKSAKDYLRKYGWKVTKDVELVLTAEKVLAKIKKKTGGNPVSLAAGAFYYACKDRNVKVSKDQIGEAFYISSRTVYSNERKISKLIATEN